MIQLSPRIIVDEKVHFGKPVIEGTRVPVSVVVGHLAAGDSLEAQLLDEDEFRPLDK